MACGEEVCQPSKLDTNETKFSTGFDCFVDFDDVDRDFENQLKG